MAVRISRRSGIGRTRWRSRLVTRRQKRTRQLGKAVNTGGEHRREGEGGRGEAVLQSILAQKASCVFLSANPPGESRPMLALAPSELRVTLYSGPE